MSGDSGASRPFQVEIRHEGPLVIVTYRRVGSSHFRRVADSRRKCPFSRRVIGDQSCRPLIHGFQWLAALLETWKSQQERGTGIALAQPVPLVRSVLEITRLGQVIPILENEADAVANAVSALQANSGHDE
jgi:hypothetical protein